MAEVRIEATRKDADMLERLLRREDCFSDAEETQLRSIANAIREQVRWVVVPCGDGRALLEDHSRSRGVNVAVFHAQSEAETVADLLNSAEEKS